jgi:hypothetical protein
VPARRLAQADPLHQNLWLCSSGEHHDPASAACE